VEPQAVAKNIQKAADASNVVPLKRQAPASELASPLEAASDATQPETTLNESIRWDPRFRYVGIFGDELRREAEAAQSANALAAAIAAKLSASAPPATALLLSNETIDAWFARYFAWKRTIPGKNGSVRQDESRFRAWLSPRIGKLPIAAPREALVEAIEELRDDLDDAVRAYNEHGKAAHKDKSRTSGKNAAQVWGVLVTGFNYASTAAKRSGLRVRADNPCDAIRAPEKSPDKYKTVLRPIEWTALAAYDDVPREWRETYAVLLYTGLRPGEARVLEWKDLDFVTNKIRVAKAWDYDAHAVKPTKTWETRDVPIEPALRPLVVAMHARVGGRGVVLPMLSSLADETAASKVLRRHLDAAGVKRADLFAKSTTQIAIRLRSFRDTYVTWRLWRGGEGDKPIVVQRNAGHKRFSTTEKYVGDVDKLSPDCGEPFPRLPSSLVGASDPPQGGSPPRAADAGKSRSPKPGGFKSLRSHPKSGVITEGCNFPAAPLDDRLDDGSSRFGGSGGKGTPKVAPRFSASMM
jgi:integrase